MGDEPKIFPIENYSNGNRKRAQTIEVVDGDILSLISAWHENGSLEMEEFHIYYGGTYFKLKDTRWDKNGREVYFELFHNPFNLNYELEDTIKYSKNTFYLENGHRRERNSKHIFTDRDIEGIGNFRASEKSFYHGKSTEWNSEGQIISERNYLDGKADGASFEWHSNSQISWKVFMKQGKFHGKSVTWHSNGQKKEEGIYVNHNKDGKWVNWNLNGKITLQENYKDGELID